jgi:hypothetical protein
MNYPYTNEPKSSGPGAGSFIFFAQPSGVREEQVLGNTTTTDCFFAISLPFTGKTKLSVTSSFIPEENFVFHGDDVRDGCIPETIAAAGAISPLLQIKAGIAAGDVVCKEGLELVVHPNGKPYCATPATAKMLKERWHI